jgi:AcrR family transcriptional regulator
MPSDKRSVIVAAARELFWKYGFRKVSVEEICQKAGISKMTFYRHFPNKTELAKRIFDKLFDDAYIRFIEILAEKSSPEEKLQKILMMKVEETTNISRDFLQDFYSMREPELAEYMNSRTQQAWQNVLEGFKKAQADGTFRSDFKPEIMLLMSNYFVNMMNDPAIMALYDSPQELLMEISKLFVYGIAPHK